MNEPPRPAEPGGGAGALRVVRRAEPQRLELVFHGELDMDTLSIAQREVAAAEREAPPVLVLDLARMGFVDSSGVRLVLLAQHSAADACRRLAVRLGHGRTRRMFDTLGVTDHLEVLDLDAGDAPP